MGTEGDPNVSQPVNLNEMFNASAAQDVSRLNKMTDLAALRQSDGAAFDNRALGGVLASALLAADDPSHFAGLNAGVRIPTTLDHPNAVVKQ